MIHEFSVENYYSFAHKATLHFNNVRQKGKVSDKLFVKSSSGEILSKLAIVVGPNGSGKTNMLKAFSFVSFFVLNSFKQIEAKNAIPFDSFQFSDQYKDPACFEVVFDYQGNLYKYILEILSTHVVKEELYVRDNQTRHFNYLFKRSKDNGIQKLDIALELNLKKNVIEDVLRENVSLVSTAIAINNMFLTEMFLSVMHRTANVCEIGKMQTSHIGLYSLVRDIAKEYDSNISLFKQVIAFLKDTDLGLKNIVIDQKDNEVYGVHRAYDKEHSLNFRYESGGTQMLFIVLSFLFKILKNGGIAIIDELEADLHPQALIKVVDLFINPETNPHNAQILFTTHSLEILNHVEKEQIHLVEKNENCESEIYRLDEIKGVRRDDNIYAKYMAGVYGAIPNI